MTLLPAGLAFLAVLVLLRPDSAPAARLTRLTARPARAAPTAGLPVRPACLLAGLAVAVLLGGVAGVVAGAGAALAGPPLLGRLEPRALRRDRERMLRDLPLVLDLLAACLAGGASLPAAAPAVAAAVRGPCGARLEAVAAALAVGSPPAEAWAALAGGSPTDPLAPVARLLARASQGGAPVAAAVSRLAADARAEARARQEQAARRVGVLVVAPLGLCFLPAFVLVGVVPAVAGLGAAVLSGL